VSETLRIAVRAFGPFETALARQFADFVDTTGVLLAFGDGVFVTVETGAVFRGAAAAFMVSTTVYWLPSFCLGALVLTF